MQLASFGMMRQELIQAMNAKRYKTQHSESESAVLMNRMKMLAGGGICGKQTIHVCVCVCAATVRTCRSKLCFSPRNV